MRLLPLARVADEGNDSRTELRVVRKRVDGLGLVCPVTLRDRVDVEPDPIELPIFKTGDQTGEA